MLYALHRRGLAEGFVRGDARGAQQRPRAPGHAHAARAHPLLATLALGLGLQKTVRLASHVAGG